MEGQPRADERPVPKAPSLRARAGSPLRRCAAGSAIEILQEKWVLHIVHALLGGPKGFNELGRDVGGCNPTTLTQRLARLEALGVVSREVHSTLPPRCSYTLTPAGHDLERVISAIRSWAVAHLPTEEPGVPAGEAVPPTEEAGAGSEATMSLPPAP